MKTINGPLGRVADLQDFTNVSMSFDRPGYHTEFFNSDMAGFLG